MKKLLVAIVALFALAGTAHATTAYDTVAQSPTTIPCNSDQTCSLKPYIHVLNVAGGTAWYLWTNPCGGVVDGALYIRPTGASAGCFTQLGLATPGLGGFVRGPGSSTDSYLAQWTGASGALLGFGLPVGISGANTVVETQANGFIDPAIIPGCAICVTGPGSSTAGYAPLWNDTTGYVLNAGLPVATTGASTIVETKNTGLLDPSIVPACATCVIGPGSSTSGYLPTWSGTGGYTLAAGLPVATTGANTVPETLGTGLLSASIVPACATCVVGPGTSTNNYVPLWNGTTGYLLAAGLPVATSGANTILELNSGGLINAGVLPTDVAYVDQAQTFTAAQRNQVSALTISTATFTPNFNTGQDFTMTLVHASCPCTLANPSTTPVAGQAGLFVITQSTTGDDLIGTWGSDYEAPGGTATITLSAGANAVDVISYFVIDSTHVVLSPGALNISH